MAGLRVSCPRRVFFDLMGTLPERELVALGDQLVRIPTPAFDGRSTPWETPHTLQNILRSHRKTRGIVAGRRAVERVRVGSDSRMETFLRLALCDAGLPEPQLQVRPRPGSPFTGDLGYEELRIVIHYDGVGHFTPEQQASDQRRNFAFEAAGWKVISANAEDYREGFIGVVQRVRMALSAHLPQTVSPR